MFLVVFCSFSLCVLFVPRLFCRHFICFSSCASMVAWKGVYYPSRIYRRSGCHPLGGFFSRLLCALGFLFTLDLYLQFICLLPLSGWQPLRVLPRSPFGIPWKTSLPQLSASISSLVVSLYSEFMSTFVPPLHLQCWRTGFFSSLSFGNRFLVLAVSEFFRTYLTFNFLARFHFSVSYSASVKGTLANSMLLILIVIK